MEDFKVVSRGKGKIYKNRHVKNRRVDIVKNEDFDVGKCETQIKDCRQELSISDFWTSLSEQFESKAVYHADCGNKHFWFDYMVVYGIGSISSSVIAKYQLALTLLLKNSIKVKCFIYDPVLSAKEIAVIEELGFDIIEENEECKRKAEASTLYFMLHCGKAMYNNVIWANWGDALANVCVLGNAFSSYEERLTSREFLESAKFVKQILPYTIETSVKNSFYHRDIFNDTAIHTFPAERLLHAPVKLWDDNEEPPNMEDDTEIIRKH